MGLKLKKPIKVGSGPRVGLYTAIPCYSHTITNAFPFLFIINFCNSRNYFHLAKGGPVQGQFTTGAIVWASEEKGVRSPRILLLIEESCC